MITTIEAVIIDDEESSRKVIKSLLAKFFPEVKICGEAENVKTGFELIQKVQPELVFLDVQMPGGNGFRLLEMFESINFSVIFITGYDEFAIQAIRFNALDYLLKPVELIDLENAIKKALEKKLKTSGKDIRFVGLLQSIIADSNNKKVIVHQNEKVLLIDTKEIEYIEADGRYSLIHTVDKKKYTVTKTLKDFELYLTGKSEFFRINKEILLNISFVSNYTKGEPCIIETKTGVHFEISRRKKQEFLDRIKNK